jgi:hypothetical protein
VESYVCALEILRPPSWTLRCGPEVSGHTLRLSGLQEASIDLPRVGGLVSRRGRIHVRIAAASVLTFTVLAQAIPGGAARPTAGVQATTTLIFDTSESRFTTGVDNQGWYARRDESDNASSNYLVGRCCLPVEHRNFFTFDLRDLTPHVVSATLRLYDVQDNLPSGPQALRFFDVTTPARRLNLNNGAGPATFFDLGHGKRFGTFDVTGNDSPSTRWFHLNARGIHAINQARGGFFSIGGRLLSTETYFLFGGSDNTGRQRLTLEVA